MMQHPLQSYVLLVVVLPTVSVLAVKDRCITTFYTPPAPACPGTQFRVQVCANNSAEAFDQLKALQNDLLTNLSYDACQRANQDSLCLSLGGFAKPNATCAPFCDVQRLMLAWWISNCNSDADCPAGNGVRPHPIACCGGITPTMEAVCDDHIFDLESETSWYEAKALCSAEDTLEECYWSSESRGIPSAAAPRVSLAGCPGVLLTVLPSLLVAAHWRFGAQ